MLLNNLATRPFYNESALRMILTITALVVLAATIINVARIRQLRGRDTRLVTQSSQDESRTEELKTLAARVRSSVDPKAIDRASSDARQANELIDRRVFSWTELFNRFEATLPDDVRITTVRPRVDARGGIALTIAVAAKTREDINQFIEKLEATGAFRDLLAHEDHLDEQGQLEATLEALYTPTEVRPSVEKAAR